MAFRIFAICGPSDLRGTDVLGSSIFRNLQVYGSGPFSSWPGALLFFVFHVAQLPGFPKYVCFGPPAGGGFLFRCSLSRFPGPVFPVLCWLSSGGAFRLNSFPLRFCNQTRNDPLSCARAKDFRALIKIFITILGI